MANTGNVIITERDVNPDSPSYGQTRTRTIQDTSYCQTGKNYKAKYTTADTAGYTYSYCNGNPLLSGEDLSGQVVLLEIGDCVTTIGENLFHYSSTLKTVTMLNNVTRINDSAFNLCSELSSVTLSKGLKTIGNYAFAGCSKLANIEIPEGVETIGQLAFSECSLFTEIVLPSTITVINTLSFRNCPKLVSFTVKAKVPPAFGKNVFDLTPCTIYVPAESLYEYRNADLWNNYALRIQPIQS